MVPSTGNLVSGGVVPETEQALRNMGAVLGAAGADFNNIVKATVLLQNMNDFAAVNDVYVKYFPKNYPARAAYQVAALPKGAQVEIEAVAILGEITDVEHTES
ncbi:2-iminobutanoate/2-iminopropanoate deaminase-like isoform X3 [Mytilus edulis]|uniref:2-iminobutanoate/2-iminopropanoate deaminase-like isoform X3 n=1 Tax=Mytilus edulis TaxID=6550 RepID=UPI0039F11DD3